MMQTERGEQYQRIVDRIDQLPSLPVVVSKLIAVVNAPDTSADDAAVIIQHDPALTSKMLRVANSAFYGIPRTVSSVSSAVVILGFNTIRSLALSASLINMFPIDKDHVCFDRNRFWKHSIVCAAAARCIADSLLVEQGISAETAFCAGIIHDIGKLIFEQFVHEDYRKVRESCRNRASSLLDAERRHLGMDHAEVGRILSDKWALPLDLEYALVYHHAPETADRIQELAATIHIADCIAYAQGHHLWENEPAPTEWPGARALIGLSDRGYAAITAAITDQIEKTHELFAILRA